ncbi:MAG: MarR family transcriptional regulator [Candidatus Hodarchaeota archaeon]
MSGLTPTAIVVLQELAEKGPMTPLQIRKEMGLASRTVSTALQRLTDHRLCRRVPNLLDMRQSLYAADPVRMKEMQIDLRFHSTAMGSRPKIM